MTTTLQPPQAPDPVPTATFPVVARNGELLGPLPLVIGVTGHRDLRSEDVPALENLVRATIRDAQARYPHTPLIVLSPLAEGSDRLVARVARELGARLFVPLPLPRLLYEQDFETDASRAEFRRLIARAESAFELPVVHGNTTQGIAEPGEQRNRQYAQVGAFVARHSQIFLALWDGVDLGDDRKGGTAEIVRFRLAGAPGKYEPATSPLTFASIGAVHHIVTPRAGAPVPDNALTHRVLAPPHQSLESAEERQRWMDQFNEDVLEHRAELGPTQAASKAQLLQIPESELRTQVPTFAPPARIALDHYAIADGLAVRFANEARAATRRLYLWVFAAALFFNLFHSLPHPHVPAGPTLEERLLGVPWLLLLFLGVSLAASLWVHRRAEEEDYQNKHQDYRALAEALRIQFFWRVAGLPDAVVDHYLRKQRGALEWIRNALRAWDAESVRHKASEDKIAPLATRLAFVAHHWVTEQRNYYASRARREQAKLEAEERRIRLLVQLSVALALLLALALSLPLVVPLHALEEIKHVVEDPWVHGIVMVAIVTLAVAAGLRHGYNQQMAFSEHAKQFGRMSELFDAAERSLAELLQAGEHHQAADLLKDLGAEALEENGDWVLLHRERPLEVPHSG